MDFQELLEKLRNEDEVTLLELLELSSGDIVDGFLDHILDNVSRIAAHYE